MSWFFAADLGWFGESRRFFVADFVYFIPGMRELCMPDTFEAIRCGEVISAFDAGLFGSSPHNARVGEDGDPVII